MASTFKIENIISKLDVAPLQPAYFKVNIIRNNFDVSMLCQNAQLPGIQFQTTDVRQSGIGNVEKRPTDVNFQDFTTSFIVDGRGDIVEYFHTWMQSIYKFDALNGLNTLNPNSNLATYMFEYPSAYESIIEISQYAVGPGVAGDAESEIEKEVIQYKLFRAFPYSIGTLQVGWDSVNQYHILPVQFYYQSWSSNKIRAGEVYEPSLTYLPPSLNFPQNNVIKKVNKLAVDTITGIGKAAGKTVDSFVPAGAITRVTPDGNSQP